jgi:hypothetical protein
MFPITVKQILALVVALLISALSVAWGYESIDSVHQISIVDRLTPLLLASTFSLALLLTAVRFVRQEEDGSW